MKNFKNIGQENHNKIHRDVLLFIEQLVNGAMWISDIFFSDIFICTDSRKSWKMCAKERFSIQLFYHVPHFTVFPCGHN